MSTHTLRRHRDIRSWVRDHHGTPAIRRIPNRFGEMESRLELTFRAPKAVPENGMPRIDDGMSPISWTAWLAELDRRQLGLRVSDLKQPQFQFVRLQELN